MDYYTCVVTVGVKTDLRPNGLGGLLNPTLLGDPEVPNWSKL